MSLEKYGLPKPTPDKCQICYNIEFETYCSDCDKKLCLTCEKSYDNYPFCPKHYNEVMKGIC